MSSRLGTGAHPPAVALLAVLLLGAGCAGDPTVLPEPPDVSARPPAGAHAAVDDPGRELPRVTVERLAEEELAIDLSSALRITQAGSLELQAARARVAIAAARARGESSRFIPSVGAGGYVGSTDGAVQDILGDIEDADFDSARAAISLDWILNPGQAIFDRLAARRLATAAAWQAESKRQAVLLQGFEAYHDLLDARQLLGLCEARITSSRRTLALALARVEAGLDPAVVLAGERRALTEAERARDRAARDAQSASADLAQVLALEPDVLLTPIERAVVPLVLVDPALRLNDLLAVADQRNPLLSGAAERVEAAVAARRAANWAIWSPLVAITFAPWGWTGTSLSDLRSVTRWSAALGWRFRPESFAQVDIESARVEAAEIERKGHELALHAELVRAYVAWRSAEERLRSARATRAEAAAAERSTRARFEAGLERELDWVLAGVTLAEAELEEGLAITAVSRSQARLLAAVGEVDVEALAPSVPEQPVQG